MTRISTPTITALLDALKGSIPIFENFLRSIPAADLDRRRGKEFWTLHEHAAHLAEVQPMGLGRMQRMLNEDVPEFVPYFPSDDEETEKPPLPSVEKILIDYRAGREQQLKLLAGLSPEDWRRTAIHPEYTQYGLFIFARHILMHDHWHMYRMEELWLTRDEYLSGLHG